MRTEEGIKSSDSNSEDNAFQTPELPASRSAAGLARSRATTTATAAAIAAPAGVRGVGVIHKKHPTVQGAWHSIRDQTGVEGEEQ